jgi:hypothetical protein
VLDAAKMFYDIMWFPVIHRQVGPQSYQEDSTTQSITGQ